MLNVVDWLGKFSRMLHYEDPKRRSWTLCGMFFGRAMHGVEDYPYDPESPIECKRCRMIAKARGLE